MNCHRASRLLSEKQDRKLILKEALTLNLHTILCKSCRHYGLQIDVLRQVARQYVKGDFIKNDTVDDLSDLK